MPTLFNSLLLPDAGRGTGVEFHGSNYPFVSPNNGSRGLLADLWLTHDDATLVPPFRVSQMLHMGRPLDLEAAAPPDEHPCDLVILDAAGSVVCDTRLASRYDGRRFGNRFFVHEWRFPDRVCSVVQHAALDDLLQDVLRTTDNGDGQITEPELDAYLATFGNPIPELIIPTSGELDERTHELLVDRLLEFEVGGVVISGNVILVPGFNIVLGGDVSLTQQIPAGLPTSLRSSSGSALSLTESVVSISIEPGGGDGSAPGCDGAEAGLRSINIVNPTNDGRFTLSGVACIDVSPPPLDGRPLELLTSTLKLSNHCGACCACTDYVATYKQIRRVYERIKSAAALAEVVRYDYHDLLDRWDSEKLCRESKPLRVGCSGAKFIRPYPDADPPKPPYEVTYVTIACTVCNTTDDCLFDVQVRLAHGWGGGVILNGSNFQTYDDGSSDKADVGSGPVHFAHWDQIAKNQSVFVQFTLMWEPINTPSGSFTVCATATAEGQTLPLGGAAYETCDTTVVDVQVLAVF